MRRLHRTPLLNCAEPIRLDDIRVVPFVPGHYEGDLGEVARTLAGVRAQVWLESDWLRLVMDGVKLEGRQAAVERHAEGYAEHLAQKLARPVGELAIAVAVRGETANSHLANPEELSRVFGVAAVGFECGRGWHGVIDRHCRPRNLRPTFFGGPEVVRGNLTNDDWLASYKALFASVARALPEEGGYSGTGRVYTVPADTEGNRILGTFHWTEDYSYSRLASYLGPDVPMTEIRYVGDVAELQTAVSM